MAGLRGEDAMPTVMIDVDPETIDRIGGTPDAFSRELRLAAALFWYAKGQISQGQGAEMAGLSRREFLEALGRAEVDAIQITPEALKEEVARDLQTRRERLATDLSDRGRAS
jgi:predicted HTH domain antitoxin